MLGPLASIAGKIPGYLSKVPSSIWQGAAVGVGGAAAIGWMGARGDPAGIPAGVGGLFGGGPSGAFSGAILGGALGTAAVGLAAFNPGARRMLAAGLARTFRSGPVQRLGRAALEIPSAVPGAAFRQEFAEGIAQFASPHFNAMTFLQKYLTNKQLKLNLARGAVVGAMGGGIIGAPIGAARRAYAAGAQYQ